MKQYCRFLPGVILFFIGMMIVNAVYSQQDNDERKEKEIKTPYVWPERKITQQTIHINPPIIVNFKERADYELAHPPVKQVHFIEQGEDKDKDFKFSALKTQAGMPVFHVAQPREHGQNNEPKHLELSPAPTAVFDGVLDNGTLIPPDIQGAAGPGYIMQTTNQQFNIYTKTGQLNSQIQLSDFFSNPDWSGFFDPHILYDPNYGRFIVCSDGFYGNDGGIFIGVSQTSDPTGAWNVFGIDDSDSNENDLLDYPEIGFNNNWVVITANDFLSDNVVVNIYVLNRNDLYNGSITQDNVTKFTDDNVFTWVAAQTYDVNQATEYMVTNADGSAGAMQIGSITGTADAPVYNPGGNIAVDQPWNDNTAYAQQAGGTGQTIDDDDDRVMNGVVYLNNALWFTHTVFLPANTNNPTYSGVDWWQINPAAMTVLQFGRLADANDFYYYPSLNVNSNGDALLGYCISSADSFYASAAYSFHAAADAPNTMESRYIFKAGQAAYFKTLGGGSNRWGDFTGTAVDPNDNSFWTLGQWAEGGSNANDWGTEIAHVAASEPPQAPPVANFASNIDSNNCSGVVQFTDLSTNLPTSWLWNFGDGDTSSQQNPVHEYTTNGSYTVVLKATNAFGSGAKTDTDYIVINLPPAPAASNVSHCGASTFSLSASTTNSVTWFDSAGAVVSTSNPFVTPNLTHTATYWVEDTVPGSITHVGPADSTISGGSYFAYSNPHEIIFNCTVPQTLLTVDVYSDNAASRTIQLWDVNNNVLSSITANIGTGHHTVMLNMPIPAQNGLQLVCGDNVNATDLFRNNQGVNFYPFNSADGTLSLTGSDAGAGYYYYFYNWKVKGPSCISERRAVTAVVGSGSIDLNISADSASCHGSATGSVSVTASGGTPGYSYIWNNGQSASHDTALAAGTYKVTVTDAGACSATASAVVSQPDSLGVSAAITGVLCNGQNSGAINITVSGGTTAYSYNWGAGITTKNRSDLTAGTYALTVTDAHSCTAISVDTVSQPTALHVSITTTNSGCGNAATGSATAHVLGGSPGYNYTWSDSATAAAISNLHGGTYIVTVSDSHGCTKIDSASISNSGTLSLSMSTSETNCYGDTTGSALAAATGDTNVVHYSWSNGDTGGAINNLTAGLYTVTASDIAGCSASVSQSLLQPDSLIVSIAPVNAGCGIANGSAVASSSGGTAGYSYYWDNNDTTAAISNLQSGIYYVTVTDAHHCMASNSTTILSTSSLVADYTQFNATCFGDNNGSISVQVLSGAPPYSYLWSNNDTTTAISNLIAGNYILTITDGEHCEQINTITVSQPDTMMLSAEITDPTCGGTETGYAIVNVTGGTPGYSYFWSNDSTTASVGNLAEGNYSVTVFDSHGCSATLSVTLIAPASSIIAHFTTTGDSCYGDENGSVLVSASGGNGPYGYSWSNNSNSDLISGLAAGNYMVTVTDTRGCSVAATAVIMQPGEMEIIINGQNASNGNSNGSATVDSIIGGTPPYHIVGWSDGQTTATASNLAANTYSVTISDANGCETSTSVVISDVTGIATVSGEFSFSVYPNPAKGEITIDFNNTGSGAILNLKNVLGQTLVSMPVSSNHTVLNISNYSDGVYLVELRQGDNTAAREVIFSQ